MEDAVHRLGSTHSPWQPHLSHCLVLACACLFLHGIFACFGLMLADPIRLITHHVFFEWLSSLEGLQFTDAQCGSATTLPWADSPMSSVLLSVWLLLHTSLRSCLIWPTFRPHAVQLGCLACLLAGLL